MNNCISVPICGFPFLLLRLWSFFRDRVRIAPAFRTALGLGFGFCCGCSIGLLERLRVRPCGLGDAFVLLLRLGDISGISHQHLAIEHSITIGRKTSIYRNFPIPSQSSSQHIKIHENSSNSISSIRKQALSSLLIIRHETGMKE